MVYIWVCFLSVTMSPAKLVIGSSIRPTKFCSLFIFFNCISFIQRQIYKRIDLLYMEVADILNSY